MSSYISFVTTGAVVTLVLRRDHCTDGQTKRLLNNTNKKLTPQYTDHASCSGSELNVAQD